MNKRILLIAAPLVLALAAGAATLPGAASSADGDTPGGITVQGTASVSSVPDRAELSFGVESQGQTARAALAANNAEMRKVLAAVRAAGGTELKTQSVSIWSRYSGDGALTGYVATNSVSTTIRELGRAGAVIDAAVDAGANQVHGPSLSGGDRSELYRQALRAAVADARASAQALAAAANVALGRVTAVVENGSGPEPIPFAADKAQAAGSAGATPLEPGTQKTTASVTVTFSVS